MYLSHFDQKNNPNIYTVLTLFKRKSVRRLQARSRLTIRLWRTRLRPPSGSTELHHQHFTTQQREANYPPLPTMVESFFNMFKKTLNTIYCKKVSDFLSVRYAAVLSFWPPNLHRDRVSSTGCDWTRTVDNSFTTWELHCFESSAENKCSHWLMKVVKAASAFKPLFTAELWIDMSRFGAAVFQVAHVSRWDWGVWIRS